MRTKHPKYLSELNWNNVYDRPDLQIAAIVLKMQDNFNEFSKYSNNIMSVYAFADAAYNGGETGLKREIRACTLIKDCDPRLWFGNVEKYCMKSKVALYGNRSACDINRHHVKDVMIIRAPKYRALYLTL